jgi:hypothetical protein
VGYTDAKKAIMLLGDSDLANFDQAMTIPQGAVMVSTQ